MTRSVCTPESMLTICQTGDVLMLEGRGLVSRLIMVATGQQVSHVALIVRFEDRVYVRECKKLKQYTSSSLEKWLGENKDKTIYFGMAAFSPEERYAIQKASVRMATTESRLPRFVLLAAYMMRLKIKAVQLVCSRYVQACWETGGFVFDGIAMPGDFLRNCIAASRVIFDLEEA